MNLEEHEIESMSLKDVAKYMDEQLKRGKNRERTQEEIAKIRGVSLKTLRNQTKPFREKRERKGTMEIETGTKTTQTSTNDVRKSEEKTQENTNNVRESTQEIQPFNDDEIKALKNIIKERELNIELFHEYRIYRELEKVPIDEETIRSAFTMSKGTTERLKRFSQVRRIPLQDLVELAVINLLDRYDKKE